jgi:predicted DNA-binding protein (MmcQ/YjbR family)
VSLDSAGVLAYCLAKPGAWQDEPWEGDVVAKVADKIFAFVGGLDSRSVSSAARPVSRPTSGSPSTPTTPA